MDRAYSLITVKAMDDEKRIITGIASTPTPDRIGDVLMPKGAEFTLPIPLLMFHDARSPIGEVTKAKVTNKGIEIEAKIAKIDTPGVLKDKIDEALDMLKAGLVKGLSVGFRGLESAFDNTTGGFKFLRWAWLELSAVTIPANSEATIHAVKSIDLKSRSAAGQTDDEDDTATSPATGAKEVKPATKEVADMNLSEQIAALKAKRARHVEKMEQVTQKSLTDGRTMTKEESEEFDLLKKDVDLIDSDLARYTALESAKANTAKGISTDPTTNSGSTSRDPVREPYGRVQVKKAEPGIRFARFAKCVGMAKGNILLAQQFAERLYGDDHGIVNAMKAAVAAGTTLHSTWASPLVGDETSIFADFVEFLRPATIVGKFGTNGIPALRRVPFRVRLVGQTSGGSGYWVGEGKPKPLTKFDFSNTVLLPFKVANIAVTTMELLRDSSPSAEMIVRDQLAAALRERMDLDFVDPVNGGVANVTPASITNDISPITSAGTAAANVRTDIAALVTAFLNADNPPSTGVILMSMKNALNIALMQNALGQPEFPGITVQGGTLLGFPVITSEYLNALTTGGSSPVIMVNASDIYFADDGDVSVDMSMEASLEMSDAPSHNSDTPTAASLVSMFQTNSVAFRAERTVSWARRREGSVAMIGNAAYAA